VSRYRFNIRQWLTKLFPGQRGEDCAWNACKKEITSEIAYIGSSSMRRHGGKLAYWGT
jgi:hypothetical protein